MKKILYLGIFLGAITHFHSQVGINTATPDPSAILDIKSGDKGVLFPQLALQSAYLYKPLSAAPPDNTIVFNTATVETSGDKLSPGYYVWRNGRWISLILNGTSPKIVAKFQAVSDDSFDFNGQRVGEDTNVKIFGKALLEYDTNMFEVVSPDKLKILKSGTYLVAANLGLKNDVYTTGSQAQIEMAYFYGETQVSPRLMAVMPQRINVSGMGASSFNYSLTEYINITNPEGLLTLRERKTFDDSPTPDTVNMQGSSSTVTIIRIGDAH